MHTPKKISGFRILFTGFVLWLLLVIFPGKYFAQNDCAGGMTFYGNLTLGTQLAVDTFPYQEVTGNLGITGNDITNLDGLSCLTTIGNGLSITWCNNLVNTDGLSNLVNFDDWLTVYYNQKLPNVNGFTGITKAEYVAFEGNPALDNLDGLVNLDTVTGMLAIDSNPGITQIDGLASLKYVGRNLLVEDNVNLMSMDGLSGLQTVGGTLWIDRNGPGINCCGLYPILTNGGLAGGISGLTQTGCTPADIIANGPCDPFVYGFRLVDAVRDVHIQYLFSGDQPDLTFLPTDRLNIQTLVWPGGIDKVDFDLNAGTFVNEDKNAPFYMAGDNGYGGYFQYVFSPGNYYLNVTPVDQGVSGRAKLIDFQIIQTPLSITGYSLIDALNDVIIGPLNEGEVVDLSTIGTDRLNIIAHTYPEKIGSVDFTLNHGLFTQYDNNPPYCLARNNIYGGYYQYTFAPGVYTLMATPWSGSHASGNTGIPDSISFTVVSNAARLAFADTEVRIFPNPFENILNLHIRTHENTEANLRIFTSDGREVYREKLSITPERNLYPVQMAGYPSGIYLLELLMDGELSIHRIMK